MVMREKCLFVVLSVRISMVSDYSIPFDQIDDEGVSYTVTVSGNCISMQ